MRRAPVLSIAEGFTLIEVLIVVAILAILTIAVIMSLTGNRDKAADAKMKSDLDRLKIAFEDYYNDHNCYPPAAWFASSSDCNSGNLRPYLNAIPCDPKTGLPYKLETDVSGCGWYKLYGKTTSTPDSYCTGGVCYGYIVSSSNIATTFSPTPSPSSSIAPSPTPSPSPSGSNLYYYCSSLNNCSSYNPTLFSCTPSYTNDPYCGGGAIVCGTVGSCTKL